MQGTRYVVVCAALCVSAGAAFAQGRTEYLNFEAPQVNSITVGLVEDHPYLFVCNTPDNSVEVYDTCDEDWEDAEYGPLMRIPVGLQPVSVLFVDVPGEGPHIYTANWLGDSVTIVAITGGPSPGSLGYQVKCTAEVGDEPMDLTFYDRSEDEEAEPPYTLFVAKRTFSSIAWIDALTGEPVLSGVENLILTDDGVFADDGPVPSGASNPSGTAALKEPHAIEYIADADQLIVLGHRGGGAEATLATFSAGETWEFSDFNLDLWFKDLSAGVVPGTSPAPIPFGYETTTNFNMALSSTHLYIVGTRALNDHDRADPGSAPTARPTGFVQTLLVKINRVNGVGVSRDLNRETGQPADDVVDFGESLAHATDVAVLQPASGPLRVIVAAFNSDRVAMIDTSPALPKNWPMVREDITAHGGNPMAGPRSLAIKLASTEGCEIGDRIYVMNQLDNSVSVLQPTIHPTTPALDTLVELGGFALANDPVPDYIRDGQQFLYSAEMSELGVVACASCHPDGRMDQERWVLDGEAGVHPVFPVELGQVEQTFIDDLETGDGFSSPDKGPLTTQSLQGLLNFEVGGTEFDLVTNAPYHWRGDKPSFLDFNEAFVNLMGMTDVDPSGAVAGLSSGDMLAFEEFINSIHYPPNPEEPRERVYSGELGDADVFTNGNGSGAKRGLKLFHIFPTPEPGGFTTLIAGRSCVQCHTLPEGSNNRITCVLGVLEDNLQPLESAALRGMRQKEARLDLESNVLDAGEPDDLRTGDWGMGHAGSSGFTIDGFLTSVATAFNESKLSDINEYVRQFDHGVGPMIGNSVNVTDANSTDTAIDDEIEAIEDQVEIANCGLAVYLREDTGGGVFVERGFYYRITQGPEYQEMWASTDLQRADILDIVDDPGELAIFTATPLGSDRRIASLTGDSTPPGPFMYAGFPPSNLEFVGTTPNTANVDIPSMTANWDPSGTVPFVWTGEDPFTNLPLDTPRSLLATRLMQAELVSQSILSGIHHEAPRRLQLTGTSLIEGAQLRLGIPQVGGGYQDLILPIYPTTKFHEGKRIWETAVEFDALTLYSLLFGGPAADGVVEALDGDLTPNLVLNDLLFRVAAKNITGGYGSNQFISIVY